MGIAGVSVSQLAIILLIVVVIFGTKRLKSMGGDLGEALKSFRGAMSANDESDRPAVRATRAEKSLQDDRHPRS